MSDPTPVYQYDAGQRIRWRMRWHELRQYDYLLYNLVARDIKVRYKNSLLGIGWSMLNPLLLMLVFTVVFGVFADGSLRQYPVFILVGIMPWNFFSGSVVAGANSLLTSSSLLKKVFFPREILPAATVFANLVNFLVGFVVLVVFLYAFGIGLTRHALWVPVILVTQVIFTLGLVFFLSAAHVFYRDVGMILDVGMLAWFFLTPIFYTLEMFGMVTVAGISFDAARVMRWINPMASIIDGYRTVLWGTVSSNGPVGMGLDFVTRTLLTALATFAFGYWFFRRSEHLFGEKL
jgi:ABC-type polysaccharide/polyol phosphate export permease